MRVWIGILCLLTLTGCTFRSTQLESIMRLLSPKVDTMVNYRWALDVGGETHNVYAVGLESGIMFTNETGVYLTFDGWSFRTLGGLARTENAIDIIDYDKVRVIRSRYDSLELTCGEWLQKVDASNTPLGYEQDCASETGERYQNVIRLSRQGAITEIEQVVTPDGETARVRLLTTQHLSGTKT